MEILSTPYNIGPTYTPDFVKTPEKQSDWLAEHLSSSRVVCTLNGVPVRACKISATQLEFFVEHENRILYQMTLRKLTLTSKVMLPDALKRRATFQSSIWRQPKLFQIAPGLPSQMFWKYLVSSTRSIISDSQQSSRGEAFWENRIAEAMRSPNKFRVYGLDCEATGPHMIINSYHLVLNIEEMPQYYSDGQDMSGYYKRLAIVKV